MRLLCFGDSNTYGYDPRACFGDRYPAAARWPDLLAQATGWTVVNLGLNGRSIPRTPPHLPDGDCLVVMLGSNDLLGGCGAQETAARMEHFLRPLLCRYAKILLVAPPPMEYGDWVTEERLLRESALLPACYRALAERLSIRFADAGEWNVDLAFDGVHFSEAGHLAFFNGIQQALCSEACP